MILLQGGTLVDGTGAVADRGNVLISGDRIEAVGFFEAPPDCEAVDCRSLIVAPGFIDLHSHSDLQALANDRAKSDQGVTTEVVGNCGFSTYPHGGNPELLREFANGIFCGDDHWQWPTAADYLRDAGQAALMNVQSLVGHGSLRIAHMGMKQGAAETPELDAMKGSLAESLESGAVGFSTGLMYAPGSSAPRGELVELCREVARQDKLYATHMRSYAFQLVEAIEEQIDLARASGCRLQISHFQTVGAKNWPSQARALDTVEKARREGIDVEFDSYPYLAGSTVATQLLPQSALDGGTAAMLARLRDPARRKQIKIDAWRQLAQQPSDIFIVSAETEANQPFVGCHLEQIAELRGTDPVDALIDLIIEEEGRVNILSFNQSEANLKALMQHPLCSVISDGFYVKGRPHPRLYGTFPFLLGEICRERRWLGLEEAVHKITAKPAARLRLQRRGRLEPGYQADITIFDYASIAGRATYESPRTGPSGIVRVYRNGKQVTPA